MNTRILPTASFALAFNELMATRLFRLSFCAWTKQEAERKKESLKKISYRRFKS
ncbi:MAG: hypothetical protein IPO42_15380 [Chitinophagaceae bacterium]|nr:hypothetical protein [Chitinophagaceae bacterium]